MGKWVVKQVTKSVEDVTLLSLAFCNSHQLAAQDLAQYEKLERWDVDQPEDKMLPEGEEIRLIKQGVTEQVGFQSRVKHHSIAGSATPLEVRYLTTGSTCENVGKSRSVSQVQKLRWTIPTFACVPILDTHLL